MTTPLPVNLKHAIDIHPLVDAEGALWTPDELHGLTSAVARDLTESLLGSCGSILGNVGGQGSR
ncbi:hypothetical protein ACFYO1_01925 [Nocardia sp. NPDC006044]|uniref:hypothetical protein n=1 Tax=Nocardia sp. NPDC006044 TaxID=3364306 RepID=UPI0036B6CC17